MNWCNAWKTNHINHTSSFISLDFYKYISTFCLELLSHHCLHNMCDIPMFTDPTTVRSILLILNPKTDIKYGYIILSNNLWIIKMYREFLFPTLRVLYQNVSNVIWKYLSRIHSIYLLLHQLCSFSLMQCIYELNDPL